MVEIFPKLSSSFSKCPSCKCQLSAPDTLFFAGRYILADISCTCCDLPYFHSYPSENKEDQSNIAFSKDGKYITWNSKDLRLIPQGLLSKENKTAYKFEVSSRSNRKDILLVNCLVNSEKNLKAGLRELSELISHSGYPVVVLISSSFKHLIPDEVAELWIVDDENKKLPLTIPGLDAFVKSEMKRFEKVMLTKISFPVEKTDLFHRIKAAFRQNN